MVIICAHQNICVLVIDVITEKTEDSLAYVDDSVVSIREMIDGLEDKYKNWKSAIEGEGLIIEHDKITLTISS